MNERGQYGQHVGVGRGGSTLGPRGRALAIGTDPWWVTEHRSDLLKINDGINQAVHEMILAMGGDPSAQTFDPIAMMRDPVGYKARFDASHARMQQSPLYPLWQSLVSPTLSDWDKVTGHGGYLASGGDIAKTYGADPHYWQDRMLKLRDAIDAEMKKLGMVGLRSEAPERVTTSLLTEAESLAKKAARGIEHLGEKAAGGVHDVWTFVKYGAWAVLGIGAVVALSSVVHDMRSGRDPAERYVQFAKNRSRDAATIAEAV